MTSLVGIGLKLLATVLFAVMIAIVKHAAETTPTGEIVFARSFFALIPLIIMAVMQGDWRDCIRTAYPVLHVRRSLVGATAMFTWFAAVSMLPLPEATAISFLTPLMIVALAAIVLKEHVGIYRWSAVGIGFVGVLVILYPRFGEPIGDAGMLGAILAAVSTVFMAFAAILVRKMTKTEKNAAIMFYFFVTASAFSLVSLYWGWVVPDWPTMLMLVCAGLFGGVGQILTTQAYRLTEASLLASFDYVNMVWAVLMGIMLFDEYPSNTVLIGGAIVISAGLFVVERERRLGVARKAEKLNKPL